jgi:hypothetical protein
MQMCHVIRTISVLVVLAWDHAAHSWSNKLTMESLYTDFTWRTSLRFWVQVLSSVKWIKFRKNSSKLVQVSFRLTSKSHNFLGNVGSAKANGWEPESCLRRAIDKLQLAGQNLGRVFNFRGSHLHATHLWCFHVKLLNLRLKTWPKQLLGYLPLDIALPGRAFNYKLGCFGVMHVLNSVDACPRLELKTRPCYCPAN